MSDIKQRIDQLLADNAVVLFMKGDRHFPQCGFSNKAVNIVNAMGVEFETINVLADQEIRQGIKEYGNWPTIPQLYVKGELLGGSDILWEMYQSGELKTALEGVPTVAAE